MRKNAILLLLAMTFAIMAACGNPVTSSSGSTNLTLKTMMEQLPDMTAILSASASKQVAKSVYAPVDETVIAYTGQYTLTGGIHFLFADLIQYAKYNIGALDLAADTESVLPSGYYLDSADLQDFGKLKWSSSADKAEIWWAMPMIVGDQIIQNKGIDAYFRFTRSASSSSAWDVELYLHILPPDGDSSLDQYWLVKVDGATDSIVAIQDFVSQPYDSVIVSAHSTDGGTFFDFRDGDSVPLMSMIANAKGKAVKWTTNSSYEFYTTTHDLIAATGAGGKLAYRLKYLSADSGSIGLDASNPGAVTAWVDTDSDGSLDGSETAVAAESLGFGMKKTAYNGYTMDPDCADIYALATDEAGSLPTGFSTSYQATVSSLTAAVDALAPPSAPDFSALRSEISGLTSSLVFPSL